MKIVHLYSSGRRVTEILGELSARGVSVSRQQVSYWISQYINGQFPKDCDLPRVTEFKVATFMDYEIVKDTLTRDPYQSSRNIHQTMLNDGARLSISTTKRLIRASGFTHSAPRYAQVVREKNKQPRVDFCKALIETNDNLSDIIFSDESTFQLQSNKVYKAHAVYLCLFYKKKMFSK